MLKNKIILLGGLIMLLTLTPYANAQGITTRVLATQQIVEVRENAVWDGEWSFTTTLGFVNFNNPNNHGLLWGGDLGFIFDVEKYVKPVNAHILGGYHKTWESGIRLYGGAQVGIGRVCFRQELSNQLFAQEKWQIKFTPTVGALAAIGWQGDRLGVNLLVSWDYNLMNRELPENTSELNEDVNVCYRDPLSVALQLTYALQNGATRQDGDRSWRAGLGYLVGFGETPISRTVVRLGKTSKLAGKWSAEYGMQFEYSSDYNAAKATFEVTYLQRGSKSIFRPFLGVNAGFCNVPVSSTSYMQNSIATAEGQLWSHNSIFQPGFVVGGLLGIDVRLFGRLHLDITVGYDRCWTGKPTVEGADQSATKAEPLNLFGASAGLRYTL